MNTNKGNCISCGVPKYLHGTCCGWANSNTIVKPLTDVERYYQSLQKKAGNYINVSNSPMKDKQTGIELIAEERQRQIERWGNTEAHDIIHNEGQILRAALSYLDNNRDYEESYADEFDDRESRVEKEANPIFKNSHWPWDDEEFKPKREVCCYPEIRDLVKAAALIAAEIDRLQNLPNE